MRKRVTVFFVTILCVFVVFFIVIFAIYNSDWAKKKNDSSLWTISSVSELNKENGKSFCAFRVNEGDFVDVEVDVKELNGSLWLYIYASDINEEINSDYENIETPQNQIISVQIDNVGKYKYSLDTENVSAYLVCVELCDSEQNAVIHEVIYKWCNNWTNLMYKIGIKKGEQTNISNIKTITE